MATAPGSLDPLGGSALVGTVVRPARCHPCPPKQLKISWNATAICLSLVTVAAQNGVFANHNLDVELINYAGATDQLLALRR